MENVIPTIIVCATGILIGVGYLSYRSHRLSTRKIVLDKGGIIDAEGKYVPDMSRADLREFLEECGAIGVPRIFAEEYVLQLFNMNKYLEEPPAPRLDDELGKVWGIDDDIEDLINPMLTRRNLQRIKWNQTEILELRSIRDVISYTYIKTQTGKSTANQRQDRP